MEAPADEVFGEEVVVFPVSGEEDLDFHRDKAVVES
jgi:hypothetical protein